MSFFYYRVFRLHAPEISPLSLPYVATTQAPSCAPTINSLAAPALVSSVTFQAASDGAVGGTLRATVRIAKAAGAVGALKYTCKLQALVGAEPTDSTPYIDLAEVTGKCDPAYSPFTFSAPIGFIPAAASRFRLVVNVANASPEYAGVSTNCYLGDLLVRCWLLTSFCCSFVLL